MNQVKVCVLPGFKHTKSEDGKNAEYKAGDILWVREDELSVIGWKFQVLTSTNTEVKLDIQEIVPEEVEEILPVEEAEEEELILDEYSFEVDRVGELEEIPIDRLNASVGIKSRLSAAGIKTFGDLLSADHADILKIKGIGPKTLEGLLADAKAAVD